MFPSVARVSQLQADVGLGAQLFIPELVLCAGIVLMLLLRLVKLFDRTHMGGLAVAGLMVIGFQLASSVSPARGMDKAGRCFRYSERCRRISSASAWLIPA